MEYVTILYSYHSEIYTPQNRIKIILNLEFMKTQVPTESRLIADLDCVNFRPT